MKSNVKHHMTSFSNITLFTCFLLQSLIFHLQLSKAFAIIITPPSTSSDFRNLASLLVSTFDAPRLSNSSVVEVMKWNMIDKILTEQETYNRYRSTARKMRGKKYALYLAKEYIVENDDEYFLNSKGKEIQNQYRRATYKVVGMVEMGMTLMPSNEILPNNKKDPEQIKDEQTDSILTATVGVLCVKSTHHKRGIGHALLTRCEDVARDMWNEDSLCVEVEPDNTNAIQFFRKNGFNYCYEDLKEERNMKTNEITNSQQMKDEFTNKNFMMRNTVVTRKREIELRPHFVLSKQLNNIDLKMDNIDITDNDYDFVGDIPKKIDSSDDF